MAWLGLGRGAALLLQSVSCTITRNGVVREKAKMYNNQAFFLHPTGTINTRCARLVYFGYLRYIATGVHPISSKNASTITSKGSFKLQCRPDRADGW